MKNVLTSTISLKLYFIAFIMGVTFFMFTLNSCGISRYRTTWKSHSNGFGAVNRVSNVHVCPN